MENGRALFLALGLLLLGVIGFLFFREYILEDKNSHPTVEKLVKL